MNHLSQSDPKWAKIGLGTSTRTISSDGCFITSLAMLAYLTPDVVNKMLIKGGGYTNGCLVNSPKAAEILGLKYNGKKDLSVYPNMPCIVEVDYSTRPGKQQHFCVWLGHENLIIDPIDGQKVDYRERYERRLVSFRMFEEKSQETEPLNPDLKQLILINEHEIRLLQKDAINRLYEEIKAYDGGTPPVSHDLSTVVYIVKELQQIDKQFDELRAKIVSIINS